jgi:hypothetical protein
MAVVYNVTIDQGADWNITYIYKQPAEITNITSNGTTVTFTAVNGFTAGQTVSIDGVLPSQYNFQNVVIATRTSTQFTVTNPATGTYISGGIATTAVNITGQTAALQLRSNPSDATAVLSLTTGAGITITGASGQIDVRATATQTGAIIAGPYVYDLEITDPSTSVVTRIAQGQATVSAQVTR